MFGPSWKTTTGGILAIVMALGGAAKGLMDGTPVDWNLVAVAVASGLGLIFARDRKVTSEQEGIK